MTDKTKKILNIILDVVIAIVLVFAAFLAIVSIRSKAKHYGQYTEIFGTAYLAVASDSMDAEMPEYVPEGKLEGFAKGDLIKIKLVDEEQAKQLEVGDIITFQTNQIVENSYVLNTHRIVSLNYNDAGDVISFYTKGDNNPVNDTGFVNTADVIGVYQGKAGGIGNVFLFMGSSAGFFVCIVLPTLLIVVYCIVNLILVIKKEKKTQTAEAQVEKDAEVERLVQERLAQLQAQSSDQPAEAQPTEAQASASETTAEEDKPADEDKPAE